MRHADVSQLAASGATGLLAVQVRGCLRARGEGLELTALQRSSVEEARKLLADALVGMDELQRFTNEFKFVGDKLDEVRAFRTVASALKGDLRRAGSQDLVEVRRTIETVIPNLDRVLASESPDTGLLVEADSFFSSLARFEAARGRQIVGGLSRSLLK